MLAEAKQSKLVISTFVITLLLVCVVISWSEKHDYKEQRLVTKNIASSYVFLVRNNIFQAISATYPIAALIRKQRGNTSGFVGLASEMMPYYPSVSSLQLQPNGIVTKVVPLLGNEKVIGLNVLTDSGNNEDALIARQAGQLTMTDPFQLKQGGIGAAARLPIFINDTFWGFSTALIRFPDVLESANLPVLVEAGYSYRLSYNNSITDEIETIARSDAPLLENPEAFDINIPPNNVWKFEISPVTGWTSLPALIIKMIAGLFFVALVTFLALLLARLRNERHLLEHTIMERTHDLKALAYYDRLTGLPNRTLFVDRFQSALTRSQRKQKMLAICSLDLDDFKSVNDHYGHLEGDNLLVEIANRLRDTLHAEDTISRQSGDEFTLILTEISSHQQLETFLQRIMDVCTLPYSINDEEYNISLSIGATLYPNDNADLDTLIRHADHAMYQAKLNGKNCYQLFDANDVQLVTERNSQLQRIHDALVNREFVLYYQPKVNMRTGQVFGVEALIRWLDPEHGLVPPMAFLPLTEHSEMEIQLGGWVINEAIKQIDTWLKQGIDLEVSINISAQHLQSPIFFDQLNEALDAYPAVNSQALQIEVLETSALGDIDRISGIIKSCRHVLGVNVALDDFGTGYSSLAHLRRLSASTIKIDQAFVRDLLDDPDDYMIIEGIISLARAFNRDIIAEGVESTEHGLALMLMGCDRAQGYAISHPLPVTDFIKWLKSYTPNHLWLNFNADHLTEKEQKLLLLEITTKHWYQRLKQKLFTGESFDLDASFKRCHLTTWLAQFGHTTALDPDWFSSLRQSYDTLYNCAKTLAEYVMPENHQHESEAMIELELAYQHICVLLTSSKGRELYGQTQSITSPSNTNSLTA